MSTVIPEGGEARPARCPVVDFDHHRSNAEYHPHAAFRELRAQAPVAWTDAHGGFWLISKYDDVRRCFLDAETFMSGRELLKQDGVSISIPVVPAFPKLIPEELDRPEHAKYRRLLHPVMSPTAAEALQDRILHWTTFYIDEIIERGEADLVYDVAALVPSTTVMEWLGVPRECWRRLTRAHHDFIAYPRDDERYAQAAATLHSAHELIHTALMERVEQPRDDVMSYLLRQEIDGEPIDTEAAFHITTMLIAGGADTATSLLSATLLHLHRDPEMRQRLIDDPELWLTATEEFLRRYPPVMHHARTVRNDVEVGGCLLRRGDRVLLAEGSASHDEEVFERADELILDRTPNRHLAFGIGPHRCPGMHIARVASRTIMTQILERMPDYCVLEDDVVPYPNLSNIVGVQSMPVRFTPGERRGDPGETVPE